LYSSPYIIRVIQSERMRWVGHEAHVEDMRNACSIMNVREIMFEIRIMDHSLRVVLLRDPME
jgi:hypothetical protein